MAQMSSSKCKICDNNMGIYFCYECQHVLCQTCRTFHDKFPATKRHTVTDLHRIDLAVQNLNISCKNHGQEFVYLCQNCECLTCGVCVISNHKDYSFTGVQDAAETKRNIIKDKMSNLQSKIEIMSTSIELIQCKNIPEIEEDHQKFVRSVESLATEFHNMIDFVVETSINLAKDNHELGMHLLNFTLAKLKKSKEECIFASQKYEQILNEKHNTTFLYHERKLSADMEELQPISDIQKPSKIKEIDAQEFTAAVIDQILLKHSIRIFDEMKTENTILQEKLQKSTQKLENENKELKRRIKKLSLQEKKTKTIESNSSSEEGSPIIITPPLPSSISDSSSEEGFPIFPTPPPMKSGPTPKISGPTPKKSEPKTKKAGAKPK